MRTQDRPIRFAALLLVAACTTSVVADARDETPSPTSGAPADTSSDELSRAIDTIFADLDRRDAPGCVVGVTLDGAVLHARGYGMANLEHAIPLTTRSVLGLASESKQFTAAAVLLAVEDGALSLDDTVRDHLPELSHLERSLTVRHLLHHTGGVRDHTTLVTMAGRRSTGPAVTSTLQLLARQRSLDFIPGSEYAYSNTGYFLLGQIVERVTGTSLRTFADARIFQPLGMSATRFADRSGEVVPERADGHERRAGGFVRHVPRDALVGHAGLWTTVEDLARWDHNFDENRLGNGSLVRELLRRGTLNDGERLHYARGLVVDDLDGLQTVSHGGVGRGYSALILRFPPLRLSVSGLCNVTGAGIPGRVWRVAIEVLYGPLADRTRALQRGTPDPAFIDLPGERLAQLAGAYRDTRTRAIWRVAVRGDGLTVDTGRGGFFLRPLDASRFRTPGRGETGHLRFSGPVDGAADGFRVRFEAQPASELERVTLVTPDAATLATYAGTYRSEELDAEWTLTVRDRRLYFEGDTTPFEPTVVDELAWGTDLVVHFLRGGNGEITGLTAHTPRVRSLTFVRR